MKNWREHSVVHGIEYLGEAKFNLNQLPSKVDRNSDEWKLQRKIIIITNDIVDGEIKIVSTFDKYKVGDEFNDSDFKKISAFKKKHNSMIKELRKLKKEYELLYGKLK